jgi:phenylacetate-CoA ligase
MSRFLTQKVFLPVSQFRRRRNAEMRPVFRAYQAGLQFRRKAGAFSDEQKNAWILRQLRSSVRRAARETDYYRDVFQSVGFEADSDFSFEDFARLPVLEREDIHRDGDTMVARTIPRDKLLKDATGGSTGVPTEIWMGPEERGWNESGQEIALERIGLQAGAKIAYLWGHHLDPHATDSLRDRLRSWATNIRWFDCFRLSPEVLRRYHEACDRWEPDCIIAYASALGQFAEFLLEKGIHPRNYPRVCFVTGAEKLYPAHRNIIEEVFGDMKPIHERYGGRDFGAVGIQINPRETLEYDIDWAWALVEPESDEPEAPILVTKLHADAMPMIRYRVGDVGRFAAGSCAGHPSFLLREVIGRELDRLWLPDGKWISGAQFPHLLKSFAVREFMLVQAPDYSVELQIVPRAGFDEAQQREILRTIQANLDRLHLRLRKVPAIPRTRANKWRPVVSQVPR